MVATTTEDLLFKEVRRELEKAMSLTERKFKSAPTISAKLKWQKRLKEVQDKRFGCYLLNDSELSKLKEEIPTLLEEAN